MSARRMLAAALLRQGSKCWRCEERLMPTKGRLVRTRTGVVLVICEPCRADVDGTVAALRARGIT